MLDEFFMDGEVILINGKFVPFVLGMERPDERMFALIDGEDYELKPTDIVNNVPCVVTFDVQKLYHVKSPNDSGIYPEW